MDPISVKYTFDVGKEVKEGASLSLRCFLDDVEGEGIFEKFNVHFLVIIIFCMQVFEIDCKWGRSNVVAFPSRELSQYHFMINYEFFKYCKQRIFGG